jgi:DNA invertase Pin-like site-specific DNA recombinase
MRALIWLRVSTAKQDEASQLPEVRAYCDAQGYEIAGMIEVHGESAFHGEQDPYWAKAVASDADVIVCWKVDRLDRRNIMVAVPMVNRAIAAGKSVEFATQPFIDLRTMQGRIAFAMFCEMAHEESKIKSDRIKAKHANLRAAESFMSGKAPYGYEIATLDGKKTLVPTEDGRAYVLEIFKRIAAGASLLDVARWLTAQGAETKTGLAVWNEGTVRQIVVNGTYAGRITHKGQTYMRCEALVTADVQRAAQEALKARGTRPGKGTSGRQAKAPALLKGLRCGHCGSPMYRIHAGKGASRHAYYRCYGSGPQRKGCGMMVDLAKADATVTGKLSGNTRPHMIKQLVKGTNWEAEKADTALAIKELDPLAADYAERHLALIAQLADYQARTPTADRIDWLQVLNPDGSPMTIGQHYAALDFDGKRAYVGSCQITATREGVRIVTPATEIPDDDDDYTPEQLAAALEALKAKGLPVPE